MMCEDYVTPAVKGQGHADTGPIQRHDRTSLTVPTHCVQWAGVGLVWRREGHRCLTSVSGGPPVIYR
jgi:hypothetical protein